MYKITVSEDVYRLPAAHSQMTRGRGGRFFVALAGKKKGSIYLRYIITTVPTRHTGIFVVVAVVGMILFVPFRTELGRAFTHPGDTPPKARQIFDGTPKRWGH